MNDQHLLQKSAGKAAELLGLTDWYDDRKFLILWEHLYRMMGGDYVLMNHWMQTPNEHLEGKVPANLITKEEGTEKLLDLMISYDH